jgi:hypothetical protein
MRYILPAILLFALGCAAPVPMNSSSGESAMAPKTLIVHEKAVELGDKPTTVVVPIANAREAVLDIARDPNRKLVLRIEGISVTTQPGIIYEVFVNDSAKPAGVLSFYGAEESNGTYVEAFAIDEVVKDANELRVTFKPRGVTGTDGRETIELTGRARFSRLRLVEE